MSETETLYQNRDLKITRDSARKEIFLFQGPVLVGVISSFSVRDDAANPGQSRLEFELKVPPNSCWDRDPLNRSSPQNGTPFAVKTPTLWPTPREQTAFKREYLCQFPADAKTADESHLCQKPVPHHQVQAQLPSGERGSFGSLKVSDSMYQKLLASVAKHGAKVIAEAQKASEVLGIAAPMTLKTERPSGIAAEVLGVAAPLSLKTERPSGIGFRSLSDLLAKPAFEILTPLAPLARSPHKIQVTKVDACECGAHKTHGAERGSSIHSSWCPWSRK